MFAILLFSKRSHRNIPNRRLEFNQRMGAVMTVSRQGFAFGAEVSVVADSTLVAISSNVMFGLLAQRAVAVDSIVDRSAMIGKRNRLIKRHKPMTRMTCSGAFDACRTEVPVWAIQTLMANTVNVFITSVANSEMAHVASRGTEDAC